MDKLDNEQRLAFITERVKDRPFNKKKLLQKMMITVAMAIIFGLIACVTFLLLEPVFSNWLHPEEEIEMVEMIEIPQDTEEMLPEDMLINDEESMREQTQEVIDSLKSEMEMNPMAYQKLYQDIYAMTQEMKMSTVTVSGITEDVDWFNDPYVNRGEATGYILADNNVELLILVMRKELEGSEELRVTFSNNDQAGAVIKGSDEETGLTVLAVPKEELAASTLESMQLVSLGRSTGGQLLAAPVVALGRPLGKQNSIMYGMITSEDGVLSLTDSNYKLLTTDIYGSTKATGLLMNMSGQVIGIINQSYNDETASNLISAIGITELKSLLQRMSNGLEHSYLGIKGTDVPEEIAKAMEVPKGAYVTGIVMDSPAMAAGIQSGDVIVGIGREDISSFAAYTEAIRRCRPGEVVEVVLMRQGQQEYLEMKVEVTVGELGST